MIRRTWLPLLLLAAAPCSAQQGTPSIEQLMLTGKLDEAEQLARAGGDSSRIALAELLVLRGDLAEAESLYTVLVDAVDARRRSAIAALAELAERRGDRERAMLLAGGLADEWRAGNATWSAPDQVAAGRALRLLGQEDPGAVREALAAFDAATAADPDHLQGILGAADLFLERYNAPDAEAGYRSVLERNPEDPRALVGLARVAAFNHDRGAGEPLARALQINPASVPALLLDAQLRLEAEHYDSAAALVAAALAVDSSSQEAWAAQAALAWIAGDSATFRDAERQVSALNSRPAAFYAAIAEAAGRQRRYEEAVVLASQAVAHDSNSVAALGALGTNLLRTGDMVTGRRMIERAFARDPYHLWHKNTLDLLDALDGFVTTTQGRFTVVAPARSAAVLTAVLVPLLEEAYDSLVARYQYSPPTPIRIELYDRHADFSVRTIGLAGLGALGVSFGTLLVMDAPEARPAGQFNLGSTAWHELAHTFTLGASDHRVPRWVSEGLSVLEERRARPGWGARVSIPFVQALAGRDLLPIARLNDGFVRPDRPDRISLSYYQASLVMEYLEGRYGIEGIRQMLSDYAAGKGSEQVLRSMTGIAPDSLDRLFDQWLHQRFAQPLLAMREGDAAIIGQPMTQADAALEQADTAAAVRYLQAARDRFPELGDETGPRQPLAIALWQRGEREAALAEISAVTAGDETAREANLLEAGWRLAIGDSAAALQALERANWIALTAVEPWRQRAALASALGKHREAINARRVIVALMPSDPLAARTDLAEALLLGGERDAARRELISVLEEAPLYPRAQDLLLQARRQ